MVIMLFSCIERSETNIVNRILSPQNSPGLSSFGLLSKWKDSYLYKIFIEIYTNLILKEQEKDEIFTWSEKLLKKFYKTYYFDEFKLEALEIISKQFFKEVRENILNEDFKNKQYIYFLKNPIIENKLSKEEIEFFNDDFKKFLTKIKMEKSDIQSSKTNDNIDAPFSVTTTSGNQLFDQAFGNAIILKNNENISSNSEVSHELKNQSNNLTIFNEQKILDGTVLDFLEAKGFSHIKEEDDKSLDSLDVKEENSPKINEKNNKALDLMNKVTDNEKNFLEMYEVFTLCKINKSLNFLEYASKTILNIFIDMFKIIQNNEMDEN